jgi:hypothetical protein
VLSVDTRAHLYITYTHTHIHTYIHTYTDATHAYLYPCYKGFTKVRVHISCDMLLNIWYHLIDTEPNHNIGPAHTHRPAAQNYDSNEPPNRTSIRYVQLQLPPSCQTCIFGLHTSNYLFHCPRPEALWWSRSVWNVPMTSCILWHYHGLQSFVFKGVIIIQWDSNTRWTQFMRKTSRVMGFHTINNNWNPRAQSFEVPYAGSILLQSGELALCSIMYTRS